MAFLENHEGITEMISVPVSYEDEIDISIVSQLRWTCRIAVKKWVYENLEAVNGYKLGRSMPIPCNFEIAHDLPPPM
jgi:hypothetical protein